MHFSSPYPSCVPSYPALLLLCLSKPSAFYGNLQTCPYGLTLAPFFLVLPFQATRGDLLQTKSAGVTRSPNALH